MRGKPAVGIDSGQSASPQAHGSHRSNAPFLNVFIETFDRQSLLAGQLLQFPIFGFELLDLLNLCDDQVPEHFLPTAKGLYGNGVFPK
jgi:hypothetical protein